jgi:probable HAF family extracellular repeat protein
MRDLGSLGGGAGCALGINNKGWVTGQTRNAAGRNRAFIYDGYKMKDLGQIGETDEGYTGVAINERGCVAGIVGDIDGKLHAFLYDGSRMRDLGLFRGYGTVANAINDKGWVVGYGGT